MDASTAITAAINGAIYLSKQVRINGKFIYTRNENGIPVSGEYNMLRHAGCIWAIKSVLDICRVNNVTQVTLAQLKQMEDAIAKASMYLREKTFNIPELGFFVDCNKSAKLGGNALGILAFETTKDICTINGMYALELEKGLSRFVNLETGEINCHKFSKKTQANSDFVSTYYPGEVALALITLGRIEQCMTFCRTLKATRDKDVPIKDHWLLQALELLSKVYAYRDWCYAYAKESAEQLLLSAQSNGGCVCSRGCRVEGLLAYYNMVPDETMRNVAIKILKDHLDYQVTVQNALFGSFMKDSHTRIDYTQHNISAYLRCYKMLINNN